MAKLVFGMMLSLDGYIAGVAGGPQLPPPGDQLGRHFNDHVRALAGVVYGRRMYEVMRYWDDDQPDWGADERDFAAVYRETPKWVVSRTLKDVGHNATLIRDDVGAFVRKLKEDISGEIDVAGPELAGSLTASGLIDEYRLYFRPFALGGGKPYFAGPLPALHLVGTEPVGEDAVRLTYAPRSGVVPAGVDVDEFVRRASRAAATTGRGSSESDG
jgi:dihydrofolate reductase